MENKQAITLKTTGREMCFEANQDQGLQMERGCDF